MHFCCMSDQIASAMAMPPASVGTGMAPGAVYSSWLAQIGCRSRKWHRTLLAAQAWVGRNRIDWRGTNLAAGWQPARDGTAGKHV